VKALCARSAPAKWLPTGSRSGSRYGLIRVFRLPGREHGWRPVPGQQGGGVERSRTDTAGGPGLGEHYYRGLKQYCGIEKAPVRAARAQRNHIGCARRAFLRLDVQRWHTARNWYEAKKNCYAKLSAPILRQPTRTLLTPTA